MKYDIGFFQFSFKDAVDSLAVPQEFAMAKYQSVGAEEKVNLNFNIYVSTFKALISTNEVSLFKLPTVKSRPLKNCIVRNSGLYCM